MGSNTSKPTGIPAVNLHKNDFDAETSDPRSPTPEITRTPLQGKGGAKHIITKNADLRKSFENTNGEDKLVHNNPILSAVIKNHLQSYDPRSPTQDFERTPIVIGGNNVPTLIENNSGSPMLEKDEDNIDNCIEAKEEIDIIKPKNLCNGFYDLTLNDTINETGEPLGSSTASNEAIEIDISKQSAEKPTELLETNFDYSETEYKISEESLDSQEDTSVTDNIQADWKSNPIFKILKDDPRSPSTGIDRTPLVVQKVPESDLEENVEEMSDDTLIKVLQNTNADLRESIAKPKHEGVLIYEDDANGLHETPKKSQLDCGNVSRTPLTCMKNKAEHLRSKSANTLEDTKALKVPPKAKRASYIPRLKSLSKQSKLLAESSGSLKSISKKSVVSGDCENTPPHSHRDKWDGDNSIVV